MRVHKFDIQALQQYLNNPNAFIVLTHIETPLHIPTHFMFWSDYRDSLTVLREGYKETMQPFVVSGFYDNVDDGLELQNYYDTKMKEWHTIWNENRIAKAHQQINKEQI